MALLDLVGAKTKEFSEARAELARRVRELKDEIDKAKRKAMLGIRNAVEKAAEAHVALHGVLEENPDLFVKPRSQTFFGIKVGYRKGTGELTWSDGEKLVELIRKHFAEQFDVLIKTTYKPVKDALAQLSAEDLKKIGVKVGSVDDEVFIKPTDTEIDKLVTALLKNAVEEEEVAS